MMTELELEVLARLEKAKDGVGSGNIFLHLHDKNISASQATVGRLLRVLDHRKLTSKVSNRGRVLTSEGRRMLKELRWREQRRRWADDLLKRTEPATRDEYLKLLETLRLLEAQIAGEAAEHATASQITSMRRILREQEVEVRHMSQGGDQGLTFHALLANAAGNRFLGSAVNLLWSQSKSLQELWYDAGAVTGHSSYPDHVKILRAVASRDPRGAQRAMETHFDYFIRFMMSYLESGGIRVRSDGAKASRSRQARRRSAAISTL